MVMNSRPIYDERELTVRFLRNWASTHQIYKNGLGGMPYRLVPCAFSRRAATRSGHGALYLSRVCPHMRGPRNAVHIQRAKICAHAQFVRHNVH
jgi:hypothetical protein